MTVTPTVRWHSKGAVTIMTGTPVSDGKKNKMTNDQLGGISRRVDEIVRRINDGTIPYDWAMGELQRVVEYRVPEPSGLLKRVTTVKVGAVATFEAARAFGKKNPDGIRFWLGSNFETNFLGKTEKDVPERELAVDTLTEASLDASIRAELTPAREETTLAHLYELIKRQPKGEAGTLLNNGYANIFYIRDAKDVLWAVFACWLAGNAEWDVYARSVRDPITWDDGRQVVSQVG